MDAQLANELREATNQLLDLAPAKSCVFVSSPHLQQPQRPVRPRLARIASSTLPAFSSSSKLEVLRSPTDVRPSHWPVSQTGVCATTLQLDPSSTASLVDQDAEDNLPERGLNSRIGSVKPFTANTSDGTIRLDHPTGIGWLDSDVVHTVTAQIRPRKTMVHAPINDIYINEYGERVVQGKVVGRIIGGRPRPTWHDGDAVVRIHTHSLSQSSPQTLRSFADISANTTPTTTTTPPAFFLECFPTAFTCSPTTTPPPLSSTNTTTLKTTTCCPSSNTDTHDHIATTLTALQLKSPNGCTPLSKIQLALSKRSVPTIELSRANVEPVVLHANRKQAHSATFSPSTTHNKHTDTTSVESAASSLMSLGVSSVCSSSHPPSHTSDERRHSTNLMYGSNRRQHASACGDACCASDAGVFVREVSVRRWCEVGLRVRGWVVFELLITTKHSTCAIVKYKRFSSFVKLRHALGNECFHVSKRLPKLPSRSMGWLSKYDARYLEARRRALQVWLGVVALDSVWGASEALREWVLTSD